MPIHCSDAQSRLLSVSGLLALAEAIVNLAPRFYHGRAVVRAWKEHDAWAFVEHLIPLLEKVSGLQWLRTLVERFQGPIYLASIAFALGHTGERLLRRPDLQELSGIPTNLRTPLQSVWSREMLRDTLQREKAREGTVGRKLPRC